MVLEGTGVLCDNVLTTCILGRQFVCDEEDGECTKLVPGLVFPFLALAIGLILQPLTRMAKLPYTPTLIVAGCLLGVLGCPVDLALLTESLQLWVHISPPTLFFYVFLAPLVFESSFNADFHRFTKSLWQILYLAFPMVTAQIFLVALFQLKVIQSPQWNLFSALTFGAMLSATDPISVSSTLKELGASENLNTLIEGESLLNDGSAVVFFEAFQEAAEVGDADAGEIIVLLLRLSLGGMAMGLAFGLLAILVLSVTYEAFEVEVSITIVVAFLGFWTAQAPAVLSGVICNVTSGLVLGAFGKQLVSPSVRDPLRKIWHLLSWVANTIVFVYAGLLVVAYIWTCAGDPLQWYDYLHILSWFAYMNVVRMVLVMLSHPFMRWGQPWYTWKEGVVLGYSGLRGAVTLILALEVGDNAAFPVDVRSRIVVWSAAFVGMTLLLNGTTIRPLLGVLGLDKQDPVKKDFLWRARALMVTKTFEVLDQMTVSINFLRCSWSAAAQAVVPAVWIGDKDSLMSAVASMHESVDDEGHTVVSYASKDVRAKKVSITNIASEAGTGHGKHSVHFSYHHANLQRRTQSRPSLQSGSSIHDFGTEFDMHSLMNRSGSIIGKSDYKGDESNDAALAGLESALQGLHHEVGSSKDIEVRRRALTSILRVVREGYESSLLSYLHLQTIEDDLKEALDANEEGEVYNLVDILHTEVHTDWSWVHKLIAKVFGKARALLFRRDICEARISLATMIFSAVKQVHCETFLEESPLVRDEIESLFDVTLDYLNRMEAVAPSEYAFVQTDQVVMYLFGRQIECLESMQKDGVLDCEEADSLRAELVSNQRKYVLRFFKRRKPERPSSEKLLRSMPLFQGLDDESFKTSVIKRGHFLKLGSGTRYAPKPGSIVVVLKGSLRLDTVFKFPEEECDDKEEGDEERTQHRSRHHLCFPKFSVILSSSVLSDAAAPVHETIACEICGSTSIFVLGSSAVQEFAHSYEWFRAELARNAAKVATLEVLSCALTSDPDFKDSMAARYALASSILELLPYSSLIDLTKNHGIEKVHGPGVLLQGKLLVMRRDLSDILLENHTHDGEIFEAPAVLPAGLLVVELVTDDSSEEASIAELVVQDLASHIVVAEDRIERWSGRPEVIDTNGRFGIAKHADIGHEDIHHEQNPANDT